MKFKKIIPFLAILTTVLCGCGRSESSNSASTATTTYSSIMTSPTTTQNITTTSKSVVSSTEKPPKEVGVRWNVPLILQNPELPTGCEITSMTMIMNFYGYEYTKEEMNNKFLNKSNDFFYKDGQLYGPNPNKFFLGDPSVTRGYGLQCFSDVWVDTLNKAFKENKSARYAYSLDGKALKELEVFLDGGPILISASITMNLATPQNLFKDFETGEEVTTYRNFHCVVLTGYDEENYYINDPLGTFSKVEKSRLQKAYESTGSQNTIVGVEKL